MYLRKEPTSKARVFQITLHLANVCVCVFFFFEIILSDVKNYMRWFADQAVNTVISHADLLLSAIRKL
jgi:hypothetical protein